MNILITGCAEFIGNVFATKILKTNKNITVVGIDSLNNFLIYIKMLMQPLNGMKIIII